LIRDFKKVFKYEGSMEQTPGNSSTERYGHSAA